MAVSSARSNYDIFLECYMHHMGLSRRLSHSDGVVRRQEIQRGDTRRRFYGLPNGERQAAGESSDGEASQLKSQTLVDGFATRLFMALPRDLRTMSSSYVQNCTDLPEPYSKPYSMSKIMLICSNLPNDLEIAKDYLAIAKDANIKRLYVPIVSDYVKAVSQNHGSCEICERRRFKLTEHHLIPRAMHGRFLKQGSYIYKYKLKQVAWLCRGCHEFIHQRIKPKVLAEKYSSVELLLRRHDVREWAKSIRKIGKKVG